MKLQKNFFFLFSTLIFILAVFFSAACVTGRLGDSQAYPYYLKGITLLIFLGLALLIILFGMLWSRLDIHRRLLDLPVPGLIAECLCVSLFLIIGFILRIWVIKNYPITPESDYRTYYALADLISRGTLLTDGSDYCDYVSVFPHVFGYPAVLSFVFKIFGTGVTTALVFNLFCSMGSCVLIWRIVRNLSGRASALFALLLSVLWPSQILYSSFVAREPLFTFLLLLAMQFFVMSLKDTPYKEAHPWTCTIELMLFGFFLAFGSFIYPIALILLIAALICMISGEKILPTKPKNDLPLGERASDKGWKRCLTVLVIYILCSALFRSETSYAVDRELTGGLSSFGYNLMTGLNSESSGGWNQDDADYLYAALDRTGSAKEAQLACGDIALQRLNKDPRALMDLFVHKFEILWGNDDYASSWNILFMDRQRTLTPQRSALLEQIADINNIFYLFVLLLAGIGGCIMLLKAPDGIYCCTLLFCGTAALYLVAETRNHYHYHVLCFLTVLAGTTIGRILHACYHFFMYSQAEKDRIDNEKATREAQIKKLQEAEAEIIDMRAKALHAQFDMDTALKEGHITIIASQAVTENDNKQENNTNKEGNN